MNHIAFPSLGLKFLVNPTAFSIGSFRVQWYSIIIAVGFALAIWYCIKRAPRFGVEQNDLLDLVLIGAPIALIGARLYYVLFRWSAFAEDPVSALYLWNGGLAIYGALIFAVLAAWIVCRVKKIKLMNVLDLAAPGFLIGQAIGRWGNFINAESYGETIENWTLGMSINGDLTVHPIFLYESLWTALGFVLIHFLAKKRRFYGQNFLLYVAWYGIGRGYIEGIRGADTLLFFDSGIRVSQVLGYLSAAAAVAFLIFKFLTTDRGDTIELADDEALAQTGKNEKQSKEEKAMAEIDRIIDEAADAKTKENKSAEDQ